MSNYAWLDKAALAGKGAVQDWKVEWEAHRYLVGGKMFGMQAGHKDGRPLVTFKLPPADGLILRQKYPDKIIPGYYMNKEHWNSVYLDSDVPQEIVENMAAVSYKLILTSLTKRAQAEIALL